MKPSEWKRLVRPWVDERWGVTGTLAYVRPGERHVLTGVLAERSSSEGFYLWQLRLPLYGPAFEVLNLNWSDRIGGGSRTYAASDPATEITVREAMEQALIEDALGEILVDPPGGADNAAMQEVRAYGLLLEGNLSGAVECLRRVERTKIRLSVDWQRRLLERASEMRVLIEAGEVDAALERLWVWRTETLANLGIEAESSSGCL